MSLKLSTSFLYICSLMIPFTECLKESDIGGRIQSSQKTSSNILLGEKYLYFFTFEITSLYLLTNGLIIHCTKFIAKYIFNSHEVVNCKAISISKEHIRKQTHFIASIGQKMSLI